MDFMKELQKQQINTIRRAGVNYINKSLPLYTRPQRVGRATRGRRQRAPRSQPFREVQPQMPIRQNPFMGGFQPPPIQEVNLFFNGEHYGAMGSNSNPFESGKVKNLPLKSSNPVFDKDVYKQFNKQIYKPVDLNEDPEANYIKKGGQLVGQVIAGGIFGVGSSLLKNASLESAKSGLISGMASSALSLGVPMLAAGAALGVPYLAFEGYKKGKKIFDARKGQKVGSTKKSSSVFDFGSYRNWFSSKEPERQRPPYEEVQMTINLGDIPGGREMTAEEIQGIRPTIEQEQQMRVLSGERGRAFIPGETYMEPFTVESPYSSVSSPDPEDEGTTYPIVKYDPNMLFTVPRPTPVRQRQPLEYIPMGEGRVQPDLSGLFSVEAQAARRQKFLDLEFEKEAEKERKRIYQHEQYQKRKAEKEAAQASGQAAGGGGKQKRKSKVGV